MRILAIETSCDDSAVAYLNVSRGKIRRLESLVSTQEIHKKYGGVVPEVAAREHTETLPPLFTAIADKVIGDQNGKKLAKKVDVIAVTGGPGLVTSLRVGVDAARALALAWKKPLVRVNHIEGHIASAWLSGNALSSVFPALVLVVSGGHTELLLMRNFGKYTLLGSTRDDAVGEAFDKTAKLMGLGFPGGPAISRLAEKGNPHEFDFPKPMIGADHDDFSFSGFKTAVRYFIEKHKEKMSNKEFCANVAASVEESLVDTLVLKTEKAAKRLKPKTFILAGGVAANRKLRARLEAMFEKKLPSTHVVIPPMNYCTDNAAMIAMAGYFLAEKKKFTNPLRLEADPHWELGR